MFTLRRSRFWAACALVITMSTGCFGYNRSAKRTAYFGDALLLVGGSATVAAELLLGGDDCEGPTCMEELSPITGPLVAGSVLITAGIVGLVLNLTRPNVKTSR